MPTKNSKIISARIPDYMEFKVPVSKVLTSVYTKYESGEIGLDKDGIVLKGLPKIEEKGIPQIEIENDPDGEWVREMAHDLNISVKDFKRRIEQSIRH